MNGKAFFAIDKTYLGEIGQAVTGAMLKPYVYIENLEDADKTIDIDYVKLIYHRL